MAMVGGAAASLPLSARAQQPAKIWRIGVLETVSLASNAKNIDALQRGLRDLGYVENQNYVMEYRSADGDAGRFSSLAEELVRLRADLIVTRGTPAARAAKSATESIPIVMAAIGEPLGTGIIASLARPGGNATGLSAFVTELAGKRVELLKELHPGKFDRGHFSPTWAIRSSCRNGKKPERRRGRSASRFHCWMSEAGTTFRPRSRPRRRAASETLLVGTDGLIQENRQLIADLAAKHRLQTIFPSREFVEVGGLMAYGVSYPDLYFRSASLDGQDLSWRKAGDLPVEQPTKLELSSTSRPRRQSA